MFTVALTRRYFRELPLRFVLIPALNSPVLCFPWHREAVAAALFDELVVLRGQYLSAQAAVAREKRVGKISKATLENLSSKATRARRVHLVRVAAANGYTWPGSGGCYSVEFAE